MSQQDADLPSFPNEQSTGLLLDARAIAVIRIAIMAVSLLIIVMMLMSPPTKDIVSFIMRVIATFFVAGLFQAAFLSMIWNMPLAKTLIVTPVMKVLSVLATATIFVSLLDIPAVFYFAPILIETAILGIVFRRYLPRPVRIILLAIVIISVDALLLLL